MFELFFLLLPIAAGYGWYMGQRNAKQQMQQQTNRLSREYVDSISFLLSDQKDKATDLFLDLLKDENDSNTTFEAHLTLGNLFRSRGEIERAIRIHQSLLQNITLTFEQKLLAMHQLGLDYIAVGIYDRAEKIYLQLMDDDEYCLSSLQHLLSIYQILKEWQLAISIADKLVKLGKTEYRLNVAQFYCELASHAIENNDFDQALILLKKAIQSNKQCARVSLLVAQVHILEQHYQQAIEPLERILEQDKLIVSEGLPMLQVCYQHVDKQHDWFLFLERCVAEEAGETAELLLADAIDEQQGRIAAQRFVQQILANRPGYQLFCRLMDYYISEAEKGRARESLILLRSIVEQQVEKIPSYCCQKCGFSANTLYWLCPSCRSWETVKPNHYLRFNSISHHRR